jgi:VanZ family protein
VMYGGWGLLWCWLLIGAGRRLDRAAVGWLIVGGAAYGVFDELTQAIVGRQPDVLDFVLDMLGVLLAIWVATWWQRRTETTVSSPE